MSKKKAATPKQEKNDEQELMNTPEAVQAALAEMPWPPYVQFEENQDPVRMTEMDISWLFCTILGMRWHNAVAITDLTERKFLYHKAIILTEQLATNSMEMEKKRQELEKKIEEKLQTLKPGYDAGKDPDGRPTIQAPIPPQQPGLRL